MQNEWTDFVAPDGGTCRVACDHYHRYPEDIGWMQRLGVKAYRMGIEWSRLQDRANGPLNERELAHYRDVLDALLAAGIKPMVVLHHFSNPPWITAQGGWTNPATIEAFTNYVGQLANALRDRVRIWNTFNEPDTYASCTYLLGEFPPRQRMKLRAFRRTVKHMARAHAEVCGILRRIGSSRGPVEMGFTKNWTVFEAFRAHQLWDRAVAGVSDALFNQFVLREFLSGPRRDAATFLGFNYYGRVRFNHFRALVPVGGHTRAQLAAMGIICDDMFERHPTGMETTLLDLHARYRLPIYITEHGSASEDDEFRTADLRENLAAVHRAIARGADVRGFFYWSLLDNFEWQFGYAKKFGLVGVDFASPQLPRTLKPIGEIYARACADNCVP